MLELIVALFNIAGMIATVATLFFGVYTYRQNTIAANARRVREVLLDIERISSSYAKLISELLFAPISHSIAMLVCEEAISRNDISLARNSLNAENNRVKNHILVGIDRTGKYENITQRLSELESMPMLLKEDISVVSRLLHEAIALQAKSIRSAISPQLYDSLLEEENIGQFLDHSSAITDPKEFAEELAIYFDHGPMLFLKGTGKKTFKYTQVIISQIVGVWVAMDDNALHKQRSLQKSLISVPLKSGTYTGDMRQCLELIKDWIPRDNHIAISEAIARLEEVLTTDDADG